MQKINSGDPDRSHIFAISHYSIFLPENNILSLERAVLYHYSICHLSGKIWMILKRIVCYLNFLLTLIGLFLTPTLGFMTTFLGTFKANTQLDRERERVLIQIFGIRLQDYLLPSRPETAYACHLFILLRFSFRLKRLV
jgi:hypothetical protein